jgi:hypothetical protein
MKRLTKYITAVFMLILYLVSLTAFGKPREQSQTSKAIIDKTSIKYATNNDENMLDRVQKATFQWFLDNADPITGLIADRSGSVKAPATIAGTGFGLTVYAIAAERGWISRQDAAAYTLKVVKGLYRTPQGPEKEGVSGYHGYFYHFLDPATGLRATPPSYWYAEISSIDTALLMAGVIFARNYYDAADAHETEIRRLCNALYDRVDWPWLLTPNLTIGHGYTPESGKIKHVYKGYSEAMLLYILAISSTQHPVPSTSWNAFIGDAKATRPAPYAAKMIMLPGMPLFTYQYPMVFIDFRGMHDSINRRLGFDYFENSRRATLAQWYYAQKNVAGMRDYGQLDWGFTASDGPDNIKKEYKGKMISFRTYSERGAPGGFDDGTIAPTAAISSIIYAPEIVKETIRHWLTTRPELFNHHGFTDAFNPTFDIMSNSGWVDPDRLSIDQGPILMMIENYRTGLIWRVMRRDEQIKNGLRRAGFEGGWIQ